MAVAAEGASGAVHYLSSRAGAIELNRMAPTGIAFEGEPLVHFARGVEARISAPVVVPHGSRGFIGLGRELAETLR